MRQLGTCYFDACLQSTIGDQRDAEEHDRSQRCIGSGQAHRIPCQLATGQPDLRGPRHGEECTDRPYEGLAEDWNGQHAKDSRDDEPDESTFLPSTERAGAESKRRECRDRECEPDDPPLAPYQTRPPSWSRPGERPRGREQAHRKHTEQEGQRTTCSDGQGKGEITREHRSIGQWNVVEVSRQEHPASRSGEDTRSGEYRRLIRREYRQSKARNTERPQECQAPVTRTRCCTQHDREHDKCRDTETEDEAHDEGPVRFHVQ
ncbi:hypothetical protein HRbin27_01534 [bacterium HR27]|nr:hypothetical protein HRbin27_01534 [bacterium HR27]